MLQYVFFSCLFPENLFLLACFLLFLWFLTYLLLWFQLVCQTDSDFALPLLQFQFSVLPGCRSLTTHSVFLSHQTPSSSHSPAFDLARSEWLAEERESNSLGHEAMPCCKANNIYKALSALTAWMVWKYRVHVQWELPTKIPSKTYMKLRSTDYQHVNIKYLRHFGICTSWSHVS